MKKIIKWVLILGLGLVGLFAIALVLLPRLIQPNDYKTKISAIVQEKTGRILTIPGDIHFHVSPKLDVVFSLGEVVLQSGAPFPDTPFAVSRLAEVRFALWPLITQKQLRVQGVFLSGVTLNLVRKRDGKSNWDDLAGGTAAVAEPAPQGSITLKEKNSAKALPDIDIGSVVITDINVRYQDLQKGQDISLTNFNLTVGHIREGSSFPVTTDFTLGLKSSEGSLDATIQMQFGLTIDLARQHFLVENYTLNALLEGAQVPSSKLELELKTDLDIDMATEKIVVKSLQLRQGAFGLNTAFSLSGFASPTIDGKLEIDPFSPRSYLEQLQVALPEFSDPTVLENFSASLGFRLGNGQLAVSDIQIEFDGTTVQGRVVLKDIQKADYDLDLRLGELDLDRYMVKKTSAAAAGGAEQVDSSPSSQEQVALPVEFLQNLSFAANVTVQGLKVAKLHLSDIVLKAQGKDGLIRLQPLGAKLYDGEISVTGEVDVRPAVPHLRLKENLHNVQLGPLFVDLTGREELSGQADMELRVSTTGMDRESLTRNSNGELSLSFTNGRIARLQILDTIRTAKSLLSGKGMAANASSQPTGFARLTASGVLTNGVFRSDDLAAESELMKISGKGTIDLVREEVDYLLTILLTDRVERKKDTGLVNLGNTPIPYRIKGKFTKLEQSAALEELLTSKVTEALLDTLGRELGSGSDDKESSGSDGGSLLNRGLKSIFGN